MTPEQRFTKIENLLQTITEIQARHEGDLAEVKESQKQTGEQLRMLAQSMNRLSDMQERTESRLASLIEQVDRVVARLDKHENK